MPGGWGALRTRAATGKDVCVMASLFFNDNDRNEPEDLFGAVIDGVKLGWFLGRIAVIPFLILFAGLGLVIKSFGGKEEDKDRK